MRLVELLECRAHQTGRHASRRRAGRAGSAGYASGNVNSGAYAREMRSARMLEESARDRRRWDEDALAGALSQVDEADASPTPGHPAGFADGLEPERGGRIPPATWKREIMRTQNELGGSRCVRWVGRCTS